MVELLERETRVGGGEGSRAGIVSREESETPPPLLLKGR